MNKELFKNQYATTIFGIGAFAVLIIVGMSTFDNDKQESKQVVKSSSSAVLELEEDSADLGTIDILGGKVQTEYKLVNKGKEDVVITSATTSCGCTEGEIDGLRFGMHKKLSQSITVKAGETKTMIAVFDPLAHGPEGTGKVTRELILGTNSENVKEIRARFQANVTKQ